jgi:hypothetical protein
MERRYREPEKSADLWWQIALGVFLGLLAHSMVVGSYTRYEAKQALKQLNAETAKIEQQMKAQLARATPQRQQAPQTQQIYVPTAPLRDGERCIQGRRFQRVENGWIQLPHEPC